MRKRCGFTLIELLVVISIIALLIGILLPALGAARSSARRMQSNTQIRGIHQAMVMFAQGNRGNFPGLTSSGRINPATAIESEISEGDTVRHRTELLLLGNFFTPEYALSPGETYETGVWEEGDPIEQQKNNPANVVPIHVSYAMLHLQAGTGDQLNDVDKNRHAEWSETLNTSAIVLSDRNINNPASLATDSEVQSIWTSQLGEWRGGVARNDNSVTFETTHRLDTQMGNGPRLTDDNIFDWRAGQQGEGFLSDGSAADRGDGTRMSHN